mmetsp:Transcript_31442/g.57571  ORF Transcript_31442/g.57571 Transcript_31442/m.57571 type:complete len:222 (-) Transcript_31442:489-1154(-)
MLRHINTPGPVHQQVCHVRIQHIQLVLLFGGPLELQMIFFSFPVNGSHGEDLTIVIPALGHVNLKPRDEIHPLAEQGDLVPKLLLETRVELLRIDGRVATSRGIKATPVLVGSGGGRRAAAALPSIRQGCSFSCLFQPLLQRVDFGLIPFSHGVGQRIGFQVNDACRLGVVRSLPRQRFGLAGPCLGGFGLGSFFHEGVPELTKFFKHSFVFCLDRSLIRS